MREEVHIDNWLSTEKAGVLRYGGARMALLDIAAGYWGLRQQLQALVGRRLADSVLQQGGANGGASFALAFVGAHPDPQDPDLLYDCIAAYQAAGFGEFNLLDLDWTFANAEGDHGRVVVEAVDTFEAWAALENGEQASAPVCAYTAGVLVGFVNVLAGRRDVVCIERACQAQGAPACRFELLPVSQADHAPVAALAPAPELSNSLNLLDILFARMPMGIVILDRQMCVRRFNPTWAEFIGRYSPSSAAQVVPGACLYDLVPGSVDSYGPLFERALAGETVRMEGLSLQSGDIVSYWDVVISPLVQEGKVVGIVDVTTDATERELALRRHKEALHNLQTQEERLALVLRATNDGIWDWNLITNEIYYSPRWKAMLGYLEQEIEPSVSAWQELVHPEDREEVLGKVEQHLLSEMDYFEYRNRLRHKDGDYRWVLTRGITLRSANGEPYRMVGANADVTEQVEAEQALSRQRAFENIITTISTRFINLDADEIDAGIHEALQTVAEYTDVDRSYLFQYDRGRMVMNCTHEWNAPHVEPQIDNLQDLPVDSLAWSNEVLLNGEVLHIPRVADLPAAAAAERVEFERQGIRSLIAVPLRYRNETIGLLGFDSVKQEKTWSPQIIALLRIVGEIFVNALENKRAQESLQQAYQTLELRVEQRTQEIERRRQVAEGLRDILSVLNSHRPLDKILDYIVERAAHFLNTPVVALYLQSSNSDLITIRASRGMEADLVANITLQAGEGTVGRTIQERRPVVIPDVNTIKIDLQAQQAPRGEADVVVNQAHKDALDHMRQAYQAVLAVPLMVRTEVSGALALYYPQPREFSPEDIDLALSFADQAALAIENARLQAAEQARLQESERRRRVAEGLREVLRLINTRQPLTEILNYIACQAAGLLHADATLIRRVDESGERVRSVAGWQVPPELEVIRETPYYHSDSDQALLAHQPVSIPDLRAAYTPEYLAGLDELSRAGLSAERDLFSSFLMVPIQLEKDIFGSLRFYFTAPRQLSDEEVNLGMILGEQAALAIENANLRAQAAEMAVLTERNRLARELHDAVTQTLFSASLMAEVLPRLWERNEAEGRRRLEELRQLTRGALAEMRTLLLELRPGHLVEADFSDLVRQLADAFNGRVRIPVDLMVKGKGKLPGEVQVAMYRIAQEALNNIAKHSQASQVEIALRIAPERVELLLADNGRGFDLQRLPADRLGLGIMRERAESIGAQYSIHSHPGSGTRVQVIWVQEERGEK